ncbi:MAG: ATP-binding protein [Actinomycetota bacterium]|nr:ATP-binding protein [Actinomycetota bacterium]
MSKFRAKLEPRFDDVVLVVSELVTNSVRHSFTTKPIQMQVKISDSRIRLEVSDWGTGFDAATSLRSGGLGLLIVDRVAASWGVEINGVCTVWVEISKVPELATGFDSSRSQSPVGVRQPSD